MNVALALLLVLAILAWLIRWRGDRLRRDSDALGRNYGLLLGAFAVAALLATGRFAFAGIILAALLSLRKARLFGRRSGRVGPGRTVLRARLIEVEVDGNLVGGRVTGGAFAGRNLNSLDGAALAALYAETARDGQSRSTLEVYLDRRVPRWRENMQGEAASGRSRASNAGAMSEQEAYEILGLQQGAGEADIRAAHRRLMKRVHPDQGGSTFLAVRINQAKDRLLSKHV